MPTPTQNQLDTLRAIKAGKVTMTNTGHASFRIRGAVPSVVGRTVSLGWAIWPKGVVGEQTCELTQAGTAIVDAADRTVEAQ